MLTTLTAPVRVAPRRVIYIGLSGLMGLMAVVGFWPKYFGPLVLGTLVQPFLIHLHATVFTGWLMLFFLQAYFAATKRIRLHLALGRAGIWYGVLLIIVGLTTGVIRGAFTRFISLAWACALSASSMGRSSHRQPRGAASRIGCSG